MPCHGASHELCGENLKVMAENVIARAHCSTVGFIYVQCDTVGLKDSVSRVILGRRSSGAGRTPPAPPQGHPTRFPNSRQTAPHNLPQR